VDEKVLNIVSNNYFSIENEFDSNASELQNPKAGPSHSLAKQTVSSYNNISFLADVGANIEVDSVIRVHMPMTNENNFPNYSELIGEISSASMVNDSRKKKFSDHKNKTE
jgi:hypothetical protein